MGSGLGGEAFYAFDDGWASTNRLIRILDVGIGNVFPQDMFSSVQNNIVDRQDAHQGSIAIDYREAAHSRAPQCLQRAVDVVAFHACEELVRHHVPDPHVGWPAIPRAQGDADVAVRDYADDVSTVAYHWKKAAVVLPHQK